MEEAMTTIQISKKTWQDLYGIKIKINKKESMDSVIKTLIKKEVPGYKSEIDIQNKIYTLKKINADLSKISDKIVDIKKDIEVAIK